MLKKKIKYTDFLGVEREQEFTFHLRQSDLMEWLAQNGDYTLDRVIMRIANERNGEKIMEMFKDIIYRSYGEISLDGTQFITTKEVKDKFMQSEAFSVLFCDIVTDGKKAAQFINDIIPADLAAKVNEAAKNNPNGVPDELKDYLLTDEDKPTPSNS